MTKELATYSPKTVAVATERGVSFSSLAEMRDFAIDVVNSGLAPRDFKTPESVLVAMQHGMEVGLTPMAALQSIALINNRPVLYGDGLMAVARAHPDCEDIIETFERNEDEDKMRAICEVRRRGQVPVVRSFSVADAKKAALWKKAGPWTSYPKRMLQMRARGFAIRDAFADALKGIRCAEEERDIEPRQVNARVVSHEMILPGEESPETRPGVEPPDTTASPCGAPADSGSSAPQAAATEDGNFVF